MSSVGRCFDVGNATRVALGIWEGVLKGGEKGEKGGEKGGEGGEEMEMEKGQRLVDRGLGHKVFLFLFFFLLLNSYHAHSFIPFSF